MRQPKSQGFTKALMQNAATPLTVDNFMDMWGSHVNQMALYKGFAEAVDTMSRVFNQRAAGEIRVDRCVSRKSGKEYPAIISLDLRPDGTVRYKMRFPDRRKREGGTA